MQRVLLFWSSGKDSAWSLLRLRAEPDVEVVGLLTTVTEDARRVAVHQVPRQWLRAQAEALGLALREVALPERSPNETYERAVRAACVEAREQGATHVAFGDLFLEDIRQYRLRLLEGTGLQPLFPAWCGADGTAALARRMVASGLRALLVCVDTTRLDPAFAGRAFDERLLDELPPGVDPCAERGEFHTFCFDGPMFARPLPVAPGQRRGDGHFAYVDVAAGAAVPRG